MAEVFKGASLEARPINPNVKDKASLEIARKLHEFGRAAKALDGELVEARADDLVARYVGHEVIGTRSGSALETTLAEGSPHPQPRTRWVLRRRDGTRGERAIPSDAYGGNGYH